MSRIATEVFDLIVARLAGKASEITWFVETGYSFEEWLNFEAYAACRAAARWNVNPRPAYASLAVEHCREFADLLVADAASSVVVEVGLVHDSTSTKWIEKLDY